KQNWIVETDRSSSSPLISTFQGFKAFRLDYLAMIDLNKLDAVAGRLGEAVLHPRRWEGLMESICEAAPIHGAALLQSDVRTADIPTTPSVSESFRSYFENNLHLGDVRAARGAPLLLAGKEVVTDQDIFTSERDMMRDPLYAHLDRFRMK